MDFEQKYQKDPGMNRVKEEEKWRRNWLRSWCPKSDSELLAGG